MFSRESIEQILPGDVFRYDGTDFVCKYAPESTADRFCIVKPIAVVEYFVDFVSQFTGGNIFELGIAEGGSTALIALAAKPRRLVAVDLEPTRLAALDQFIQERGLNQSVRPMFGVDQSDHSQLREILHEEFGSEPLDLVIDDASHQLELTRTSFEVLFPHLRPGGLYTIEDWRADIQFRDAVVDQLTEPKTPEEVAAAERLRANMVAKRSGPSEPAKRPLNDLAIELVLACASFTEVIDEVTVNDHWVIVRRGPAEVDPGSFRLRNCFRDYFGYLAS